MQFVFCKKCYSRCSVFRWYKDFASGRLKLGDKLRSGAPRSKRTPAKIQECKRQVEANCKIRVHHLSENLSISYGTTMSILHKDLSLRKKAAKLVPHQLTPADVRKRIEFCTNFVTVYGARPRGLHWIITTDESWFHVYDPLSKMESMEWWSKGDERPQIMRRERSVKKVMFIPFFDDSGLVHFEIFENQTINKEVFLHLLLRVRDSIRARHGSRVWTRCREYHLHMDNAPAHHSRIVQDTLAFMEWPVFKHPPYSPDLSPCDFVLFPYLKRKLRGHNFRNVPALREAILNEVTQIPSLQWKKCFLDWIAHCRKCLAHRGQYFEGRQKAP